MELSGRKHLSNKESISKTYEELLKPNIEKTNNPIRNGKKI
jgi:hypothetical protein